MKLGHENRVLIPLCVTELICSLSTDTNGFVYSDGKSITDQLNEFQLPADKVFHIQDIIRWENMDEFIQYSPNPHTWKISNAEKVKCK